MNSRPKLLLVDDSVSIIEVVAGILSVDHEVRFATSGAKALQMIQSGQVPDMILLDVMMPEMDGYEFCNLIKQSPVFKTIPIIFITAAADAESESQALAAGAVDFIHKPINRDVLLARVRLHLGLIQNRRELEELNQRLSVTLSEVKKSRDQLQILATAIEHSPTSIVVTDLDANIEYVNPYYCKLIGYSSDEVIGQKPAILTSSYTDPRKYAELWAKIRQGEAWSGEFVNMTRDGIEYREEAHIAPVKDTHGQTTHYVSVQLDITARHEAEEMIKLARQNEMQFHAAIQKELLFGKMPEHLLGYGIRSYTAASQIIDGDFYTLTQLGHNSFEILSGDVMGKGMTAALVGAGVKNAYREAIADLLIRGGAGLLPRPDEIINEVNLRVADKLIELGVFVTLTLVRFDRVKNEMIWVNAGHTPTLLVHKANGACEELLGNNLPLGVVEDEIYCQYQNQLGPQDVVCIYSDGLSEAESPDQKQFGADRVRSLLTQLSTTPGASLDDVLDGIKRELGDFVAGASMKDDTTVILIQTECV
jgi:PAS domain S-box-containing protein